MADSGAGGSLVHGSGVQGSRFVFSSGFVFRVRFLVQSSVLVRGPRPGSASEVRFGIRGRSRLQARGVAVSASRKRNRLFGFCDFDCLQSRLAGESATALCLQRSLSMGRGAKRYTELRAWQACDLYKKAVYRLCSSGPWSRDLDKRRQIEKAVAGPPSHISEGFGRFNPPDFARYTVFAKSSLMESQNHLGDALDKGYIDEETRARFHAMAEDALEEVSGLMDYLLSPEALRNARLARERRIAQRRSRRRNEQNGGAKEEPNAEANQEPEAVTKPSNRARKRTPGNPAPKRGTEHRTKPGTEP